VIFNRGYVLSWLALEETPGPFVDSPIVNKTQQHTRVNPSPSSGSYSERQKNSMRAKTTFVDGFCRNSANSQSVSQNRQDAIGRMSAVQEIARSPR